MYKKIHYLTFDLDQGHTKRCLVPSTSCDLFTYKVLSCYLLRFRRRYICKKRDGQMYARTEGRTTDGL